MTRPSLLLAALVLTACEPAPRGALEAVSEALAAEDTGRALDLLEAQADAGDLTALARLADARSRGYLTAPSRAGAAVHLPIRTWPWSGPLATRRFEAALQDSVAAGSHNALFLLADRRLARRFVDGKWSKPDPTDAREIYERLADEDARPLRLAFLARRLGDEDAYLSYLEDAAAVGDPQACAFHFWETRPEGTPHFAAEIAREIDTITACQARGPAETRPDEPYGVRSLRHVVAERERGNAGAVALLDSLAALGLFERHPDLLPSDA